MGFACIKDLEGTDNYVNPALVARIYKRRDFDGLDCHVVLLSGGDSVWTRTTALDLIDVLEEAAYPRPGATNTPPATTEPATAPIRYTNTIDWTRAPAWNYFIQGDAIQAPATPTTNPAPAPEINGQGLNGSSPHHEVRCYMRINDQGDWESVVPATC